ncbi:MAG: hypothetical protein JNK79_19350 [Chitinophagaceae bacterium]|nr:hypothetical protein [Chitinophagaceae bacterium]
MIYNVKALTIDELATLYIKESQKLDTALKVTLSHNSVMLIKKNLEIIACELNRKQPIVKSKLGAHQGRSRLPANYSN